MVLLPAVTCNHRQNPFSSLRCSFVGLIACCSIEGECWRRPINDTGQANCSEKLPISRLADGESDHTKLHCGSHVQCMLHSASAFCGCMSCDQILSLVIACTCMLVAPSLVFTQVMYELFVWVDQRVTIWNVKSTAHC